jgi:hypothetical protein
MIRGLSGKTILDEHEPQGEGLPLDGLGTVLVRHGRAVRTKHLWTWIVLVTSFGQARNIDLPKGTAEATRCITRYHKYPCNVASSSAEL